MAKKITDSVMYAELIKYLRDGVPLPQPKSIYVEMLEHKLELTNKYLTAQSQKYLERKQKDPLLAAIEGALEDIKYQSVQELADKIPDDFQPTPIRITNRLNKNLVMNGKVEVTTRAESDGKIVPVYRKKLAQAARNYKMEF